MVITTLTANRKNYGASRKTSKIRYIVIHYTANDGDRAYNNALYFRNHVVKASAHYFVDDNIIYNSVPDNYTAYSVGGGKYSDCAKTGGGAFYGKCTNANSISIEMCDVTRDGSIMASEKTLENTVNLVRSLMAKYNVPIERVIRHFDVNGKKCPAYFVDATAWANFKARITATSFDWSAVFDATYYATRYPDLRAAGLTTSAQLLNHFVNNGMKERRQGCDSFNVEVYRNRYHDLQTAFGDDWVAYYKHYCTNGKAEGRRAI